MPLLILSTCEKSEYSHIFSPSSSLMICCLVTLYYLIYFIQYYIYIASGFDSLINPYHSRIELKYDLLKADWATKPDNFLSENSVLNTLLIDKGIKCFNTDYTLISTSPITLSLNHGIYFFMKFDPLPALNTWVDILKLNQSSENFELNIRVKFDSVNATWVITSFGQDLMHEGNYIKYINSGQDIH